MTRKIEGKLPINIFHFSGLTTGASVSRRHLVVKSYLGLGSNLKHKAAAIKPTPMEVPAMAGLLLLSAATSYAEKAAKPPPK
jgi:hypothetical protein